MKELILQALAEVFAEVSKRIDSEKKEIRSVSLEDTSPFHLARFMSDNKIPSDAYFSIEYDRPVLSYEVQVPKTPEDILEYQRRIFSNRAFTRVYEVLTSNGYKRASFWGSSLHKFKAVPLYDLYLQKDYDFLVDYYKVHFEKLDEKQDNESHKD